MTDTPKHSPSLKRTPEQQSERNTAMEFSNAITRIGVEYSKSQEPRSQEAKNLALKQLQEQEKLFNEYKKTPHGQRAVAEFEKDVSCSVESMVIGDMDTNLRDARILITGNREEILRVISEHVENDAVLVFLPKEYTENGKVSKKALEGSKEQAKKDEVKRFIDGESVGIPYFTNEEFEKYADILKPALSKPGTILSMYEGMNMIGMQELSKDSGKKNLTENPLFVATINEILMKEYPEYFGKNNKEYYGEAGNLRFQQIVPLLELIKYYPRQEKDFIKMMRFAKSGDSENASKIFEEQLSGTAIGNSIFSYFPESPLIECLKKERKKGIEHHANKEKNEKGSIYDTINTNKDGKEVAAAVFGNIPQQHLDELFSSIKEIEILCSKGNMEAIIKLVDQKTNIDSIYKERFFYGLKAISIMGENQKTGEKNMNFYQKIELEYEKRINISKENEILHKQGVEFSIISRAFPSLKKGEREEKHIAFRELLKEIIDESGNLIISKNDLLFRLSYIFTGTPESEEIFKKISESSNGVEIFKILSESFKEEKKHQEKNLESTGFDIDQWNSFQKKNILKAAEIRSKLSNPETSLEEKRAILARFFKDPTKVPTDPEEIKNLIKELQTHTHMTRTVRNFEQTKENLADFSQAWQSGDFTEFNKKTQEREQKREEAEIKKQQEQRQGEPSMKVSTAIPFDSKTNYSEIPVGQIMTLGNDTFIHKDSSNTVSVFSQGITIENVIITNTEKPLDDINKAMDSIKFFKESGLDVFHNDISRIIDAVNDRVSRGSGTKIDIANGISVEEGLILLETIGKITQEKVEIKTRDDSQLNALKRQFSMEGGGFLSKLQNTGYAKSNQIDVEKITKSIKTMT